MFICFFFSDEVPMDLDVSKAMEDIEMAELAAPAVQAYSAKYLENVDDIDKDDVENPQLVVEYVNEIYGYLRQLEVEQGMIFFFNLLIISAQ